MVLMGYILKVKCVLNVYRTCVQNLPKGSTAIHNNHTVLYYSEQLVYEGGIYCNNVPSVNLVQCVSS